MNVVGECVGRLPSGRSVPRGETAPPYTVTAIGDPVTMQEALDDSDAVTEFRLYADFIGLGYQVDRKDSVTLPAYDGPIDVSEATAS